MPLTPLISLLVDICVIIRLRTVRATPAANKAAKAAGAATPMLCTHQIGKRGAGRAEHVVDRRVTGNV
ncbi:MAG: hypothetical protein WDN76_04570 [Alphaproteobacteria bacterium]